jgi:hypothetical protein
MSLRSAMEEVRQKQYIIEDNDKDPGEYDQEGSMAKTQLRGIMRDVSNMMKMFKDDDNLPEWVQNKITKAADYLNSSNRYMTDNEND